MALLTLEPNKQKVPRPKEPRHPPEPVSQKVVDEDTLNETQKFNIQIGASFTCGVCGARHQTADNFPSMTCLRETLGDLVELDYNELSLTWDISDNELKISYNLCDKNDTYKNISFFRDLLFLKGGREPKKIHALYQEIADSNSITMPVSEYRQILVYKSVSERKKQMRSLLDKYLGNSIVNYNNISKATIELIKRKLLKLRDDKKRILIKPDIYNSGRNIKGENDITRFSVRNKKRRNKAGDYDENTIYFSGLSPVINGTIKRFSYKILYDKAIVYILAVCKEYSVFIKKTPDITYLPIILPERTGIKRAIPMCCDKWIKVK